MKLLLGLYERIDSLTMTTHMTTEELMDMPLAIIPFRTSCSSARVDIFVTMTGQRHTGGRFGHNIVRERLLR